jgi:glycogen synthase kinase 3 beta
LLRELAHPNIVALKHAFYTQQNPESGEIFLNMVMEYMPENLYKTLKYNHKHHFQIPHIVVKVYAYQLFRALSYIHALGVVHRDVKPHNLLVDQHTYQLKLCDFGSAKILMKGE